MEGKNTKAGKTMNEKLHTSEVQHARPRITSYKLYRLLV